MSRKESEMLSLAYTLRQYVSDLGLGDLLNIIDVHLPSEEFKSKYLFLKSFGTPEMKEYFYCEICSEILTFNGMEKMTICIHCGKRYNKKILKEKSQFFIYMPLKPQLIKLINSEIYTKFRQSSEHESDIISGSHYCNLKQTGIIGKNDISLQWNTDGVKLFISSKYSFWGIQVLINELPYRERKNHIILCGIWCNFSKPPMNMFLKPFCDELVELSERGFSSSTYISQEPVDIKVHVIAGIMDSVARPLVQYVTQFNGKYGCSYCLHKGLSHIPVDRGHARVYCGDKRRDRNIEEHMRFADEAYRTNKKM